MVVRTSELLPTLYEADEPAWLETMAELIRAGRLDELDYAHLQEFLSDMAIRERREVFSRLVTLLAHLLKWEYQSDKRSGSWQATILTQQSELEQIMESALLRNHANEVLTKAYAKAVKLAAAETELPASKFPPACPYSIESLLEDEE